MASTTEAVNRIRPAPVAEAPPRRPEGHGRSAAMFLAPFIVLYVLFIIGPALYGLVMSFFDTSLVKSGLGEFAGFSNYSEALQSSEFWHALWHTIWFTILTTPPLVVLALFFAIMAERVRRGRWFFRLAFFLPYVLPSAVVALIWLFLYTPALGLAGKIVTTFGFTEPNWLGDPNWAMVSLAITTVWWTLGFNFVLYLAGLQEIPQELYDASAVDGAGPLSQVRRITVPLLARTTILVVTLQIFSSLNVFDQIYIMNTSGGLNYTVTRPIIQYVYEQGFTSYRVGFASAMSYVFFVLVLVVGLAQFAVANRRRGDL
jgi:multiple sugar transport system permease protein